MRWRALIALLSLVAITSPARAEFPAALSLWGGVGLGSGHREEADAGESFGLFGIEAAWRYAPGRALVATFEGAGGPFDHSSRVTSESRHLDGFEHFALTVGPEFSFPPGSGVALFYRGSAGVGRVTTDGDRSLRSSYGEIPGFTRMSEYGFAVSGAGGLRLVFPPGPLGLAIALRGAKTFARHSSCGGMGVTFGVTLYPLDRRSDPRPPR